MFPGGLLNAMRGHQTVAWHPQPPAKQSQDNLMLYQECIIALMPLFFLFYVM
jgi:hypothetical protein